MPVSVSNQEWLWEETAHGVRQGRPLAEIFVELSESTTSPRRRQLAKRLAREVQAGRALSVVVAEMDGAFMAGTAAAIEAGEKSGRLADSLESLAENADSTSRIRSLVLHAIAYPLVIVLAATGIMVFIRILILPGFLGMYHELDVQMPLATVILPLFSIIGIGILATPALLLLGFYVLPFARIPGLRWLDTARLNVPLLGGVLRRLILARWCNAMGVLIAAGVPEAKAVRLAGESTGHARAAAESRRVAEMVEEGVKLGHAMSVRRFFPSSLSWMVRVAGDTGGHRHLWPAARDLYHEQGERWAQITSIVLRILFFLLAANVVMFTVHALFAPLIKLMNSLGG